MTERPLRYSERKRLSETGNLGPLSDEPSPELRRALTHAIDRVRQSLSDALSWRFIGRAQDVCEEHFGLGGEKVVNYPSVAPDTERLLDFLEILVDVGSTDLGYIDFNRRQRVAKAWPTAGEDFNGLFERHRFGFRFADGHAHAVASPALEERITGPALLAVQRPGWEQVERSYREALMHQRGSEQENDDALTAANAALEAALKAVGLPGKMLGELGKSLRASALVPAHHRRSPEASRRPNAAIECDSEYRGRRAWQGTGCQERPGVSGEPGGALDGLLHRLPSGRRLGARFRDLSASTSVLPCMEGGSGLMRQRTDPARVVAPCQGQRVPRPASVVPQRDAVALDEQQSRVASNGGQRGRVACSLPA